MTITPLQLGALQRIQPLSLGGFGAPTPSVPVQPPTSGQTPAPAPSAAPANAFADDPIISRLEQRDGRYFLPGELFNPLQQNQAERAEFIRNNFADEFDFGIPGQHFSNGLELLYGAGPTATQAQSVLYAPRNPDGSQREDARYGFRFDPQTGALESAYRLDEPSTFGLKGLLRSPLLPLITLPFGGIGGALTSALGIASTPLVNSAISGLVSGAISGGGKGALTGLLGNLVGGGAASALQPTLGSFGSQALGGALSQVIRGQQPGLGTLVGPALNQLR